MSLEHQERSREVFPLLFTDVKITADWASKNLHARNPANADTIKRFWQQHPHLGSFFADLRDVRHHIYDWKLPNNYAYIRGVIFGIKAIEQGYKSAGKQIIHPSNNYLGHYFESLFAPSGFDRQNLQEAKVELDMDQKIQLTPEDFLQGYEGGIFSDNLLYELSESFKAGSFRAKSSAGIDPSLREFLKDRNFYSSLGPSMGLSYGVLDANLIYQGRNQQQKLTDMLRAGSSFSSESISS